MTPYSLGYEVHSLKKPTDWYQPFPFSPPRHPIEIYQSLRQVVLLMTGINFPTLYCITCVWGFIPSPELTEHLPPSPLSYPLLAFVEAEPAPSPTFPTWEIQDDPSGTYSSQYVPFEPSSKCSRLYYPATYLVPTKSSFCGRGLSLFLVRFFFIRLVVFADALYNDYWMLLTKDCAVNANSSRAPAVRKAQSATQRPAFICTFRQRFKDRSLLRLPAQGNLRLPENFFLPLASYLTCSGCLPYYLMPYPSDRCRSDSLISPQLNVCTPSGRDRIKPPDSYKEH